MQNNGLTLETYQFYYKKCSEMLVLTLELIEKIKSEMQLTIDLCFFGVLSDEKKFSNLTELSQMLKDAEAKRDDLNNRKSKVQSKINSLQNETAI